MKCPVCYTKIKHNEYVCPNCGLTLKKEAQARLSSEPVHTKTEHIDEPIHKESKLETIKARYNNLSFYKQQRVIRSVIFCIGLDFPFLKQSPVTVKKCNLNRCSPNVHAKSISHH